MAEIDTIIPSAPHELGRVPVEAVACPVEPAEFGKLHDSKVRVADAKAALGSRFTERPGGGYAIDIAEDDTRGKAIARELRAPYVRRAMEVSGKMNAAVPSMEVITPQGRIASIPAKLEGRAAAMGFRSRVTGRRKRITSESEIRARIEADK